MKSFIITIDIGNTKQDLNLFKGKELLAHTELQNFRKIQEQFHLTELNTAIIVSSVSDKFLSQINMPYTKIRDFFKNRKFLNMPVNYSETIGDDRLITCYSLFCKKIKSVIMIDSGSYTTIDIISTEGLLGGTILPGLKLIQESYYPGANLKEFAKNFHINTELKSLPHTSEEAINSGIILSFISPILRIIEENPNAEIYLSGGNAKYLESLISSNLKQRNSSIHLAQNLVHNSLRAIAQQRENR